MQTVSHLADRRLPDGTPSRSPTPGAGAREPWHRRLGTPLLFLALGGIGTGLIVWRGSEEARAIERLPEVERHALYERTLQNVKGPCHAATDSSGLRSFCREQARFVLRFAECDAACAATAREFRREPAR
jgi:hypothetical protein